MDSSTEHYYSKKQSAPLKEQRIWVTVKGKTFSFFTGAGVFAKDRLDKGSKVLITYAIIKPKWKMLDFGCGYGVVGILLKHFYPDSALFMCDVNERAVRLAKKNAKHQKVEAIIKQGNLFEPFAKEHFDTILLNPPQVAGKELCFQMIEQSWEHLKKDGLLQLVARHNKGGKSFKEHMRQVFGNVREIGKKAGYRVYVSRRE